MKGVTSKRAQVATRARGLALVELLIAIAILAFISTLIYGAFSGMRQSKEGVRRLNDRYREGRLAIQRISRDLSSAYLSVNRPMNQRLMVQETAFIGESNTGIDTLHFASFANRRFDQNVRESDQAEISYFGSKDPERRGVIDLARRISPRVDLEADRGGRIEILATNVESFQLEYLDPTSGEWLEEWDTTQALGQFNRIPLQVRLVLVLEGGMRAEAGGDRESIVLRTTLEVPIQTTLGLARAGG